MALEKLKPGSWQGPIESGYGWHLVFVDTVIPGRIPAFEEMEPDVKTAWLGEQKQTAWQKAYAEMRAKYTVLLPAPSDKEVAQSAGTSPQETGSVLHPARGRCELHLFPLCLAYRLFAARSLCRLGA